MAISREDKINKLNETSFTVLSLAREQIVDNADKPSLLNLNNDCLLAISSIASPPDATHV
jgi:hypothetical protein